jgi:hypothetical protein
MPPETKPSGSKPVDELLRYSGLAFQMAAVLAVFAFAGHWLDRRLALLLDLAGQRLAGGLANQPHHVGHRLGGRQHQRIDPPGAEALQGRRQLDPHQRVKAQLFGQSESRQRTLSNPQGWARFGLGRNTRRWGWTQEDASGEARDSEVTGNALRIANGDLSMTLCLEA